MKLSSVINQLLRPLGIALVRRALLDELATLRARSQPGLQEIMRHQIAAKWSLVDQTEQPQEWVATETVCPLCGHTGAKGEFTGYLAQCIFGGGVLQRYQCPHCEVIFGPAKMFALTEAELGQDYEWHYQAYSEGDTTQAEMRSFRALKPQKYGVYLNYGAGKWSRSVPLLRSQGWNVLAYEPHAAAAPDASYVINSRRKLETMQFDGIFSNNLLEHLRWPVQEMAFMKSLLKPGATMAHTTPCYEYLYEYTRFHLFFFVGRSRPILAQKAGLRIVDFVQDGEFMCLLMADDLSSK